MEYRWQWKKCQLATYYRGFWEGWADPLKPRHAIGQGIRLGVLTFRCIESVWFYYRSKNLFVIQWMFSILNPGNLSLNQVFVMQCFYVLDFKLSLIFLIINIPLVFFLLYCLFNLLAASQLKWSRYEKR